MSRNHFVNFLSAEEAAKLIPDDAVIASACFGNGGWPHELAYAMEIFSFKPAIRLISRIYMPQDAVTLERTDTVSATGVMKG